MPGLENEGLGRMSWVGRITDSQVGDIVGLSRMFYHRLGREVRHKLKQDFFHKIGMNLETNSSGPHGKFSAYLKAKVQHAPPFAKTSLRADKRPAWSGSA